MAKRRTLREETCDSEDEDLPVKYEEPEPEIKEIINKFIHPYALSKKFNSLPTENVSNLINWSKMTQSDSTCYRIRAAAIFCSV